jgi:hypothetical protein
MSSRRGFIQSLAGVQSLAGAFAAGFPSTVRSGIFLSGEASPSERWAAAELSRCFGEMTGVRVPIATGDRLPASLGVIAVGRSAITDKIGVEAPEGESCLLKTVGETLVVAGGPQRGTMYGVFALLERLGCRWFTADIERIPKLRGISPRPFNEIVAPAFEYREVFFTEAQGKEWSARNRLNGHFHQLDASVGGRIKFQPFAHSFYELVPPDQYFETHPEYFALVAGKRRRENAQLCLTNPDVVRLAIGRVQEWLAADRDVSIVSVSQNDGGGWCECEACQRIVREEGDAVSGLLLRFVNQVAMANPGSRIDTLAYQGTADAPLVTRPAENVVVRLCPIDACQGHSMDKCAYNQRTRERLDRWLQIAPKLYLWHYSTNFSHYLAPFPNYRELIADFSRFRREGLAGIFLEGAVSEGGGGEDAELRSWLAARLMWNPELDAAAEIRDFLGAVYGPAAPLMWRYFVLRHREVEAGEHLWIDQNVEAEYLTGRFLKDGRELLNRAYQRAGTAAARRRIERQLLSIEYVETMRGRRSRARGAEYGPEDAARVKADTGRLVAKAEALGITNFREGYPLVEHARVLEASGRNYPLVRVANGAVMAEVVPELGARVIALSRGGAPANILRVPDPGELGYPDCGGLYVGVHSSYVSRARGVMWRVESATPESVRLVGALERDVVVEMEVRADGSGLVVAGKVANRGSRAAPVAVRCTGEFGFGVARRVVLDYRNRTGDTKRLQIEAGDKPADDRRILSGDDVPGGEWMLAWPDSRIRVRNRFRAEQVSRCSVGWSFRGGLGVNLSLWSEEVELGSGQELGFGSEWELEDD